MREPVAKLAEKYLAHHTLIGANVPGEMRV